MTPTETLPVGAAASTWLAVALAAAAVVALGLWAWMSRLRWALAREHAFAERVRAERDEALAAQATLERSLQAAEARAAAQARWLAGAVHDLRQPAHALALYAAALQAAPAVQADADAANTLQHLHESLRLLESLLAGALDLSRVDAGAIEPQWQTAALAPLLRRLAAHWAPAAEAKGLRLSLRLAPPHPEPLLTTTDAALLERVLHNLLGNAVKYTQQGGVLLACRRRQDEGTAPQWRIEVWDSGPGISRAEQQRVFDAFYRASSVPGDGRGAAHSQGLGLAIVQRLCTLLQLRVELRSRPGRGSVFLLHGLLPAGEAAQWALPRQRPASLPQAHLQGLRVAVLDDNEAARDATVALLRRWGAQAQSGPDAASLVAWPADALLADVQLAAGRHGLDEHHALERAWARTLPVLWVSAEPADSDALARLPAGAARLLKPAATGALHHWLATQQATRPAAPHSAP
jgi:two-component system, sensor histidine kinase